ncbi:AbrB/MazE/SpoVT family DNA-binding domain-containing protein (plasmid) [Bacillus sp. S3]|uniref:AbrB/MazE/SpoVT family DNA-binding domain-containing protein n=1 Tax=Bacillus sp. S3 TaxID=486398 RepID=UPI00118C59B9|nr:AbrB/MazE/SpoVT family DNA-binding domain-containing protein [Bacillus sp. S3]QCJ45510.1 AbrB/MazE/SpoVT family DNA-binding domain-containing protein [Bacillus sp. S3]
MKSTGIVRKLDELGRIVIPKELRRTLDIEHKDPVEIFLDEEKIILRKYEVVNQCMVTGKIVKSPIIVADGEIVLSTEGAELLIKQIEEQYLLHN